MRYIVTTNRHIQLIEDNDNGKILDSKGFQFGQLYYRIVKGKVTFYHFDQEHPWRNDVWSADIPLQINGELYENEEEVGNKLYEVMEDSLFDKIEDLIKEDARLDQKIGDEIDRAKEEEVKLSDKVDGLEDEIDAIDHKVDGYDEKIKAAEDKVNGLDEKLEKEILRSSEKDAEHDAFVSNFSSNLEEEVERAKAAESALTQALNSEIQRATSAETEIANDLDAEVTRATNRENEIENKLNSEITRSTEKDAIHDEKLANLDTSLQSEIKRATEAENSLRSDLNSEVSRATAEENRIDAKLDKEIADRTADVDAEEARALGAETRLESKIDGEITRSTNKDTEHDEKIASLEQADKNITNALNSEIQRALSAETSLRDDLNGEITRANGEETRIEGLLANEINRSTAKDTEHDDKIANLEDGLSEEIARAKSEEKRIDDKLNNEITRSTNKDTEHDEKIASLEQADENITNALNSEIQRALIAETNLHNEILGEKERAITAESALDTKITTEVSDRTADVKRERERAIARENEIDDKLDKEINDRIAYVDDERDRAISAETALDTKIANEISRATAAEATLNTKLKEEEDRAIARENAIDSRLDKEVTDRTDADTAERNRAQAEELRIESKINAEVTRSTNKDTEHDSLISGLTTSLHSEINRATNAENSLRRDLNGEISARTNADAAQLQRITALEVGKADANSVYTKTESDAKYTTKDYISGLTEAFFDAAAYDSQTKKINFYHGNTIKAQIDATSFIKDGMVDNVVISGSNLVITFNTDSSKEPISIPLSSIFDPSNYFTKSEIDSALSGKVDNSTFNTLSGRVDTISGDVITVSGRVDTISGDVTKVSDRVDTISGTVETVKQEIITFSGDSYSKSEVDTKLGNKADLSAFTAHTADSTVHVTSSEKNTWNNKSDFSGSYNDLTDKPTIRNYSAGTNVQIQNDVISATDTKYTAGSGIEITGPTNKITLDVDVYKGNEILSVSVNNPSGNASTDNKINGMSSFGAGYIVSTNNVDEAAFGYYNETNGNEKSFTHSSGNTLFSVGNGNSQNNRGIIKEHNAFEIRQNGDIYIADTNDTTYTHAWEKPMIKLQDALATAGGSGITSGQVQTMIDKSISGKTNQSDFTKHTANTTVHVTSAEKNTWNAKSDFSGDYNDLTNKPTIPNYTAGSGITISNNVISAKIWSGTLEQYNALSTKNADTIYLIYNS